MTRRKVLRGDGNFYFEFPSSAGVFPNEMTIIACCPPMGGTNTGLFSKGVNTQFQFVGNTYFTRFYAVVGASAQSALSTTFGEVIHRSATYNGTTGAAQIFHRSTSVATATTTTRPSNNASPVQLMRWGSVNYIGQLFEFAWYHRILTSTEIAAFIAGAYDYTGCYCHYKLDEGAGNVINDSSGNARHLTAIGTAVWEDLPILAGVSRPQHPIFQQVIG